MVTACPAPGAHCYRQVPHQPPKVTGSSQAGDRTGPNRRGDRCGTTSFSELSWDLGGFSFSRYLAAVPRCSCISCFKSLLRRSMGPW